MWGLYIDCSKSAVEHVQHGRHIGSGTYASNVKCMYTSASGDIVNYSELI